MRASTPRPARVATRKIDLAPSAVRLGWSASYNKSGCGGRILTYDVRIVSGAWIVRSLNGRATGRINLFGHCGVRITARCRRKRIPFLHDPSLSCTTYRVEVRRLSRHAFGHDRTIALAAYIVLRHGLVYAPFIDRLERELEAARRDDPTERARRILQAYTVEGGRKAIRSSHSRLCSSEGPTP
jgi:hypothetical protein